jgi:hypothetical protein
MQVFEVGMYRLFTKLGDGEFLYVASRDQLDEALQLSRDLNEFWPNEYLIRDSNDQEVYPKENSRPQLTHNYSSIFQ